MGAFALTVLLQVSTPLNQCLEALETCNQVCVARAPLDKPTPPKPDQSRWILYTINVSLAIAVGALAGFIVTSEARN